MEWWANKSALQRGVLSHFTNLYISACHSNNYSVISTAYINIYAYGIESSNHLSNSPGVTQSVLEPRLQRKSEFVEYTSLLRQYTAYAGSSVYVSEITGLCPHVIKMSLSDKTNRKLPYHDEGIIYFRKSENKQILWVYIHNSVKIKMTMCLLSIYYVTTTRITSQLTVVLWGICYFKIYLTDKERRKATDIRNRYKEKKCTLRFRRSYSTVWAFSIHLLVNAD
jgi:hypothetical protein